MKDIKDFKEVNYTPQEKILEAIKIILNSKNKCNFCTFIFAI